MKSQVIHRTEQGKFSLIAEIGVNYYDIARERGIAPLEAAKLMVRNAHEAGIHAVKFQTYKAETLAAKQSPSYWDTSEEPTRSQFELFKKFDSFGYKEYEALAEECRSLGIEFLSTPFDFESADYLDDLMGAYKISSSDLSNLPFLRHIAQKRKPVLLSVGASSQDEIDAAIVAIRETNEEPLVLLHCVLEYPTPYSHANLNKIASLKKRYPGALVGYSDHTKPDPRYDVLKTAYSLGAIVIEKHFTLNKSLQGNDHYHAMDAADAQNILEQIDFLETLRGNGDLQPLASEALARRNARRSIVSFGRIPKGTLLTESNVVYKRPGTGISPSDLQLVLGKTARQDIEDDTILQMDMFEQEILP
jgi:N-acetylneuraminate synthase